MLVLGRKQNERILILTPEGRQIEIVMVKCGSNTRIGIEATQDYIVVRKELLDAR